MRRSRIVQRRKAPLRLARPLRPLALRYRHIGAAGAAARARTDPAGRAVRPRIDNRQPVHVVDRRPHNGRSVRRGRPRRGRSGLDNRLFPDGVASHRPVPAGVHRRRHLDAGVLPTCRMRSSASAVTCGGQPGSVKAQDPPTRGRASGPRCYAGPPASGAVGSSAGGEAEAIGTAPWASLRRVHRFMLMMTAAISATSRSLKWIRSSSCAFANRS